jgi:hypothetical protein
MRMSRTIPAPEGKTRWRRFIAATTIVTVMAAGLVYLTATGAIAVSLQMSGIPFKLSATNMSGDDFVQYATVEAMSNPNANLLVPADSTQKVGGDVYDATTVTVLGTASIENLHQTVCARIPSPLGGILPKPNLLVTIDAGRSAGQPVTAKNLVVDAPLMTAGSATFDNMLIGQDLGNALGGDSNGNFSQQASHVSIDNLDQLAIGTQAGQFKLSGLNLSATFVGTCP